MLVAYTMAAALDNVQQQPINGNVDSQELDVAESANPEPQFGFGYGGWGGGA